MLINRLFGQKKWHTAGELAHHVLRQNGPQTTQQLYKLVQAIDAPAAKEYIAPHHRDYRIVDGVIRGATVRPPNPKHLIRSVRQWVVCCVCLYAILIIRICSLKQTMQALEATSTIGHLPTRKWISWTEADELKDLHEEAKEISARNKAAGESEYVWIDGERFHRARPFKSPALSKERKDFRLRLQDATSAQARGIEV